MYFDDDISNLYFLYDVQEQPYEQPSRYFYNSITTYHNYRTSQVCAKHKFTREQCFNFFKYVHAKLSEFTPNKSDEILPTLYVYHVLAHLVKMHSEREAVFGINETDIRLVDGERITATGETRLDLDFLEIGTSNFNTISQMLDPPPPIPVSDAAGARVGAQAQGAAAVAGDPLTLRGMAVEPSAEYLAQLPDRPGVLKVNAAIVPESSTDTKSSTADDAVEGPLGSSQRRGGGQEGRYLDFYHIPESVIDREGLAQFLKGCNSIGDYHLLHKKGGFTHLVQIRKVPALTIRELLTTHRVRRVRLLKIDAEGYDITILQELYHYLVASRDELLYPERILFESNDPYRVAEVVQLVQQYVSLGYNVAYSGDDTILERLR
jgi:FkbM family methyltransferase